MTIREATIDDLDLLTRLRMEFMREVWPEAGAAVGEAAAPETADWIRRMMDEGRLLSWFLYEGEELLAAASLLLYELPPKPGVRRRNGQVLNVHTKKEARRKGYGRRMMEHLVAEARRLGLYQLELHATADGAPLYRQLGFVAPESPWLELRL